MSKARFEVEEIAASLGVSQRTIYRHIKEGKLPGVKPGKSYIITRSDLAAYLGSEERVDEIFGRRADDARAD